MIRLGLIARCDSTGLGIQTEGYYRHLDPTKTLVVDISDFNYNKQFPERYTDSPIGSLSFVKGFPTNEDVEVFLEGLDVVLIAESAYNPYLYTRARELGVKTAVAYNYEFFDWFDRTKPKPDMLIAPSRWHFDDVQKLCYEAGLEHIYLHCPIDRTELPPRKITQARTFLHTAGRSAAHDRNGTQLVIEASRYLKTPAQIIVHFQGEQGLGHQATQTIADYVDLLERVGDPSKLTIEVMDLEDYADVYKQGDVLLLPRRYGGNCLPLNEALSVGMPAIMTDISPNNELLPKNWLVPAYWTNHFTPRTVVDIYSVEPELLAEKIDEFYNYKESRMWFENIKAGELAQKISWPAMKPQYLKALESLSTR